MTLARCANCLRSGTMGDGGTLLYCMHCHLSFCRGNCHAEFAAGRWTRPKEPSNDMQQTPVVAAECADG